MNTRLIPGSSVPPKRLWFGFSGAAVAWAVAGLVDVLLAWQACLGGEVGTGMFTNGWFRTVVGVITILLILTGAFAGVTSYRNWRALGEAEEFEHAEGRDRMAFMAVAGVFIAASLTIGMILFSIPVFFLDICRRLR